MVFRGKRLIFRCEEKEVKSGCERSRRKFYAVFVRPEIVELFERERAFREIFRFEQFANFLLGEIGRLVVFFFQIIAPIRGNGAQAHF